LLHNFQRCIEAKELDLADEYWHRIATTYLLNRLKELGVQIRRNSDEQARGAVPKFACNTVVAPQLRHLAIGAAPHYLREAENFYMRVQELRLKVSRISLARFGSGDNAPKVNYQQTFNLWKKSDPMFRKSFQKPYGNVRGVLSYLLYSKWITFKTNLENTYINLLKS